jgi:hypothetical protein
MRCGEHHATARPQHVRRSVQHSTGIGHMSISGNRLLMSGLQSKKAARAAFDARRAA